MAKQLLMGNEAMAYAALEAGVRVVAGYPGTPSSEIIETIARLQASGVAKGVHVEWSANEKAALELLGGAAMAGARCLFTCKQMGLNVASDPLMCLNYVGVRGGLVLVVADDPGPISSQTEQDTRRFAAFAKVPVFDPATPEQAYDMVKAAFELSELIGAPVIVRPTTRVDHASAFFDVPGATRAREVPKGGFERNPDRWVIFPKASYASHGAINARLPQMARMFSEEAPWLFFNQIDEIEAQGEQPQVEQPSEDDSQAVDSSPSRGRHASHARTAASNAASASVTTEEPSALRFGIVAGGVSASYAREALRMVADRAAAADVALPAYRFMQIGTPYPFPDQAFERFSEGLADILVFEELDNVLEDEIARFAGRTHARFAVHGKLTGEARDRGENDVDDIVARIVAFFSLPDAIAEPSKDDQLAFEGELPVRPPVLCAGCPHRGSFYAVKSALGKTPAVLCGDIGCYTLGNAKPLEAVDTCLCMGAGITMAQGLAVVDPGKKAVAFVGDSTFFASGMPGLANAAYNGHDVTVVVLDNSTTAMTGGQPHPGTGITLMGERRQPLSIEAVLRANGFTRIYRANPLDKDASIIAAKAAIAYAGPSAVIFESPCVQLVEPGEAAVVESATCIGCKKCITEIGCPAISFNTIVAGPKSGSRGQAIIDPGMCTGCGLCSQVCPAHAITSNGARSSVASVLAVGALEAAATAERAQADAPVVPAVLDRAYPAAEDQAQEAEQTPLPVEAKSSAPPLPLAPPGQSAAAMQAQAPQEEELQEEVPDEEESVVALDDVEEELVEEPADGESELDALETADADEGQDADEEPEAVEELEESEEPEEPEAEEEPEASEELANVEDADADEESEAPESAVAGDDSNTGENPVIAEEVDSDATIAFAPIPVASIIEDNPSAFEAFAATEAPVAPNASPTHSSNGYYEGYPESEERPVYNGYTGSEVFLDIPIDDEDFVHEDWYSWKRGGNHA